MIDFFNNRLSNEATIFISSIEPVISFITQIELFATERITPEEMLKLKKFIADAKILGINDDIVNNSIAIRVNYKVKLPDAIIAATALVNGFTLLTRHTNDFKYIDGLRLLNPTYYNATYITR